MKYLFMVAAQAIVLAASPIMAHDFWAGAQLAREGQPITAIIGFGHNFPEGEVIKPELIGARYNPLKLLGAEGELALKGGAEARLFTSDQPLKKAVYLVLASSIPTFRTTTPDGLVSKPKNEVLGATACRFSSSFGKAVVNVGGADEAALSVKPVGHELELVPQVNPATVRAGQRFPVLVMLNGRPLPSAVVEAYFAGFSDEGSYAFSGRTNKDGLVNIIPLKGGQWLARVSNSSPYPDPAKCDTTNLNASLTFTINE